MCEDLLQEKACSAGHTRLDSSGDGSKANSLVSNSPMSQYEPPAWSAVPSVLYCLEVLKDGISLEEVSLSPKPFYLLGRDDSCDICLAHPSISRFHAVLQHHASGTLHLYDLGSTHGSFLNGSMVKPHSFERVYSGDVVKFAGSARTYVIEGPENMQREDKMFSESGHLLVQPASNKRVTSQLQVNLRELETQRRRQVEYEAEMRARLQEVTWGMGEDAKEVAINPQDKILYEDCLLYTSPSPRDRQKSRMPSSA